MFGYFLIHSHEINPCTLCENKQQCPETVPRGLAFRHPSRGRIYCECKNLMLTFLMTSQMLGKINSVWADSC
jgi:hypothetical protein